MSFKRRLIGGALKLGVGQSAGYLLSFVRRVVTARLLTQADFGIAATFMMTVSLLEMASDMAANKLLIQSKGGDHERLQGVVHAFEFFRGALLGALLLVLASPVAEIFGVPEAYRDYQLLALAPVIRGLRHLDVSRVQRELRFGPQVYTEFASAIVTLLAIWPLIWWFGDYTAVLWVVLLREAMLAGMSHIVAERPYRWAWDASRIREVVLFGWPLALNGVLMYAAVQGDRVLVASLYSMEELGLYAAAVFLALTPFMPIGRLIDSLALPVLSQVQDNRPVFIHRLGEASRIVTLAGVAIVMAFVVAGDSLMVWLYGSQYGGGSALIAWLGMAQGIRVVRATTNVAAMSLGDTKNTMYGNLARGIGVIGALLVAFSGIGVWGIAAAGFIGEVVAVALTNWRLWRRQGVPLWISGSGIAWILGASLLAWGIVTLAPGPIGMLPAVFFLAVLAYLLLRKSVVRSQLEAYASGRWNTRRSQVQ